MLNTRAQELLSRINNESAHKEFMDKEKRKIIKRMREAAKKREERLKTLGIYHNDALNFYGKSMKRCA